MQSLWCCNSFLTADLQEECVSVYDFYYLLGFCTVSVCCIQCAFARQLLLTSQCIMNLLELRGSQIVFLCVCNDMTWLWYDAVTVQIEFKSWDWTASQWSCYHCLGEKREKELDVSLGRDFHIVWKWMGKQGSWSSSKADIRERVIRRLPLVVGVLKMQRR